jgi:hypothetical protein
VSLAIAQEILQLIFIVNNTPNTITAHGNAGDAYSEGERFDKVKLEIMLGSLSASGVELSAI